MRRGARLLAPAARVLLATLTVGFTVVVGAPPRLAPAAAAAGPLQLAEQTFWTPPDGEFAARVTVGSAASGAAPVRLEATLHRRVTTRAELDAALAPNGAGRVLRRTSVELDPLDPQSAAGRNSVVRFPLRGRASAFDPTRTLIEQPGVHPVTITALDGAGTPLATLVTFLTRLSEEDRPPLEVALLAELDPGDPPQPAAPRGAP
ncbi:MAG: hypothetical protein ACKVWR_17245, partial [Acidimicrobiales bacterium]